MMGRFRIYDLRFKIFILFLLLFINHYSLFINHVYALDSTPSANVQSKLKALQTEIASKAAKLKSEISKKLTNKAYVGVVKSKSNSTLTLAARLGTKIVNVNQDTIYDPATVKGKKVTVKEEDSIAALGDIDETGVLTARKVVILPASSLQPPASILWGQIISISDQIITVQNKALKNVAVSLKAETQVQTGQYIIVTGQNGKNDILNAKFVYIISGKEIPKKMATPSAQIATKSATPSAKKK